MVLGVDKLLALVSEKDLVLNLSERELNNPEGSGFDLRLGRVYKLVGTGYLGVTERKTPEIELVAQYKPGESLVYEIKSGETVLVTTIESVKMPNNLTAIIEPRSTLYRSGIYMKGGNVAPGYEGELSFPLHNAHTEKFSVELGSRIVHILFFEVTGESNMYRGQWQGGRVAATEKETQI